MQAIQQKYVSSLAALVLSIGCACLPLSTTIRTICLIASAFISCFTLGHNNLFRIIKEVPFVRASLMLFICIGIGTTYSCGDFTYALQILAKYRRLLFPLIFVPFFLLYPKAQVLFIKGLFAGCFASFISFIVCTVVTSFSIVSSNLHPPMLNPIYMSFIFCVVSMLALILRYEKNEPFIICPKLVNITWVIFLFSLLFINNSRTGVLGFLIFAILFCIRFWRIHIKTILTIWALIACSLSFTLNERFLLGFKEFKQALPLISGKGPDGSIGNKGPDGNKNLDYSWLYGSWGARIGWVKIALELIHERPIWGWGTGSVRKAVLLSKNLTQDTTERKALSDMMGNPHNQFLLFGIENGLIGLLMFAYFLWELSRIIRGLKSSYVRIFGYGFLITFCIACVSDISLFIGPIGDCFIMIATWLTAESIQRGNSPLCYLESHSNKIETSA